MGNATEPCVVCGNETAVGGPSFFDRHEVTTRAGTVAYLCASCAAEEAARHQRPKLSPEEVTRFVNDASLMFKVGDH